MDCSVMRGLGLYWKKVRLNEFLLLNWAGGFLSKRFCKVGKGSWLLTGPVVYLWPVTRSRSKFGRAGINHPERSELGALSAGAANDLFTIGIRAA